MTIKNKAEKVRFGLVGIANTAIDFSILFTLTAFGIPVLIANIFSTSTAFCFSFFANKKYTFKVSGNAKREFLLFIVVTLFGLWGIQTLIIKVITSLLDPTTLPDQLILVIAKVLAIIASLIWNYTLYSRVVFKQKDGN